MCTAVYYERGNIFGRTLDLECSLGEDVFLASHDFSLHYKYTGTDRSHAAFLGMAHTVSGYPLFYDGMNEYGVAVAALNFPGCARYRKPRKGMTNLASYEIIPYILSLSHSLEEARELLRSANVTDDAFSSEYPPTPLHFIVSSRDGSFVIEPVEDGLSINDSPSGVLSNSPRIEYHLTRAADFRALSPALGENKISPEVELRAYSRGLGAFGLPGDFSSSSRFVRALYAKSHTLVRDPSDEGERLNAFFHLMNTVEVPLGCVLTDDGRPTYTVYTSAMSFDTLTYYYKTYGDGAVRSVALPRA